MGAYIKGMDMPKGCGNCPYNESSCYCGITKSEIDRDYEYAERLANCPLVEVKTPHGRLIDAKAFETKNKYFWHRDFINAKSEDALCDLFDEAPTVLEAEGKNK